MHRIVFVHPDGSVEIYQAFGERLTFENEDGETVEETDDEFLDRVAARTKAAVPHLKNATRADNIDVSQLPVREFRDAWRYDGGVVVDMPAARDMHMAKIREARNEKLRELDIEQLKGNDVAAQKQRLRDLPATVNLNVGTPEELLAIWPGELE